MLFSIKKACLTLRTKLYDVFIRLMDQLMRVILLKLFFISVIKLIISFLSLAKYYELPMLKQFCKSCFFNYKSFAWPRGQKYNMAKRVDELSRGDTKMERFLHRNQHTRTKLLKFVNWYNMEVSKSAKIWHLKSIFFVKIHRNLSQLFFIEK